MNYLTVEEIVAIHDRLIGTSGGSLGIRDKHLLMSLAERPKAVFNGIEQYSDVFSKASSLLEALVRYHVFIDGNKRTGLTAASIFLRINGYKMYIKKSDGLDFMERVAIEKLSVDEIALWLEEHAGPK